MLMIEGVLDTLRNWNANGAIRRGYYIGTLLTTALLNYFRLRLIARCGTMAKESEQEHIL